MPLPLVMMRHRDRGLSLSLAHLDPVGSTCNADRNPNRVIDARIQVASLGFERHHGCDAIFAFPAVEGDCSYIGATRRRQTRQLVERFHPIGQGSRQEYEVLIHLQKTNDFHQAMRDTWRYSFELSSVAIQRVDLNAVYDASMKLLRRCYRNVDGAPGFPFRLSLPEGRLEGPEWINYQMGFIGQQLPLAFLMIKHGIDDGDPQSIRLGTSIIDFWVENSKSPAGVPRVWYDTWPRPHWREYDTFLRIAADGMVGVIRAYQEMRAHGMERPKWKKFCVDFADWLIQHQHQDGSWARAYRWDGSVAHAGKSNTTNPIPFLLEVHGISDERRYLDAASRAARFCLTEIDDGFRYVGGTPDNPNVLDKEAGLLAFDAFLTLWEVTAKDEYLQAAIRAADFTETWIYCWNVPLPKDDPDLVFPNTLSTSGFSVIATGHSGADLYLAGAPVHFLRLCFATGDIHYAKVARLLLHHPRVHVDVNGSLGYGMPGLCTEALSLSVEHGRGHGVDVWLPWLTYQMIAPIVELRQRYQLGDIPNSADMRQRRARKPVVRSP